MVKGRKPTPTKLHVLRGNPSKLDLENRIEPKPKPIAPKCPHWLSKEAKREWKRIAPQLELLGLLTIIDKAALAGYCSDWSIFKDADEFIKKNGTVYSIRNPAKDGVQGTIKYLQQVPQVGIRNKALQSIRTFCTEFGMTPSARSRIQLPGREEDDELEELLIRGKKGKTS